MFALLFGVGLWTNVPRRDAPFARDPRFVVTTRRSIDFPRGGPLAQRALIWLVQVRQRFRRPHPLTYSFPSSPTLHSCSIHGLLIQCTEVTGVRYVIARDVAAGSVEFGPTNTLNGAQWTKAFTEALETGQPEWWDSRTKTFRKENLVLLTNDARMVLVLPSEMAGEFQRKSGKGVNRRLLPSDTPG